MFSRTLRGQMTLVEAATQRAGGGFVSRAICRLGADAGGEYFAVLIVLINDAKSVTIGA